MGPQSNKRKLPAASGPAPKRSKSLKPTATTPKSKKSKKGPKAPAKRAVDVASLSWMSVGDDFGGLEVITGVDVVKDGDKVQFVVKERDQDMETHDDGGGEDQGGDTDADDSKDTHGQHHEDESFEGFGDDAVDGRSIHLGKAGGPQDGVAGSKTVQKTTGQGEPKTVKKNKRVEGKNDDDRNDEDKRDKKDGRRKAPQLQDRQAPADALLSEPSAHGGNSFGALAEMAQGDQEADGPDLADWVALDLSPTILSGIAKLGFSKPTAIQKMAIPEIIAGEDVIGKAQTGSGKTLAFGIPVVEKWLETHEQAADGRAKDDKKSPMALVLSPTRELAKQLGDHLKALCDGLAAAPYVCVVTGGLSIHKQQRQLAKADIIIGTPGRLWEVMNGDMALQESLTSIKFLVVDEADRLFKVGQFKEAEDIIGALDRRDPEAEDGDGDDDELPPRQTLVFSATFDKDLQTKLAGKGRSGTAGTVEDKMAYLMKCLQFRREPKFLDANPVGQLADKLREGLIECGAMEKVRRHHVSAPGPCARQLSLTSLKSC